MKPNKTWTLFLDRDGVINKRLMDDYVKTVDAFEFIPGSKKAIVELGKIFGRVVVVTNQQGIGKELMTEADLTLIHQKMEEEIMAAGGYLDKIYHCSDLKTKIANCRKPNPAMGLQAQKDFPAIDFKKSIMVGDTLSDMAFGKNLGMQCIFIDSDQDPLHPHRKSSDYIVFHSLIFFADFILDDTP